MFRRSYTIEKLLRLSLNEREFESIIFWTDGLCKSEDKGTGFRNIVIGSEYLYTTNLVKWKLERECHISQILTVHIVGDVAEFLRCKITRTYNHMKVVFLENPSNLLGNKINSKNKLSPKEVSSLNAGNQNKPQNCSKSTAQTATEIVSNPLTNDSENYIPQTKRLKQLDFYLKDSNVIAFKILHEAVRAYRENFHGFKSILKQLLDFPGSYGTGLTNSNYSITTPENRQTNRRRSVVMSFMAQEDDLFQIMPFFKPVAKLPRSAHALRTTLSPVPELAEQPVNFDTWVKCWLNASERISSEMRIVEEKLSESPVNPLLLMYNQITDVQRTLQRKTSPVYTEAISYLPVMMFIVNELSFLLLESNITNSKLVTESMQTTNSTDALQLVAVKRADHMRLILLMVDTIRLFVENYGSTQFDEHHNNTNVSISQWNWNRLWRQFAIQMIAVVTTAPNLPLPCRMKPELFGLHLSYSSDLERCLSTELDSLVLSVNEGVQESEEFSSECTEIPCFCDLFYQLVSDLNSEVTCILFEILSFNGVGYDKHRQIENNEWIDDIFQRSLGQSGINDPFMLNRLSSHASAKLHLLCCMQKQNSSTSSLAARIHLEDIVRTLFVIDRLTVQYRESITFYRTHGSKELIFWFRPRRLFSLFDWLGLIGYNRSELRLTKCAVVALASRIYGRVTGRSKSSWVELDQHSIVQD